MSLASWISVASRAGRAALLILVGRFGPGSRHGQEGWGLSWGACSPAIFTPKRCVKYYIQVSLTVEKTKNNGQYVRTEILVFKRSPPMVKFAGIYGLFKNMNFRNYKKLWSCCRLLQVTRSSSLGCWLLSQPSPPQLERSFLLKISKYILQNKIRVTTFKPFQTLTGDMWLVHVIHSNPGTRSYRYNIWYPLVIYIYIGYLGYLGGVRTACKKYLNFRRGLAVSQSWTWKQRHCIISRRIRYHVPDVTPCVPLLATRGHPAHPQQQQIHPI